MHTKKNRFIAGLVAAIAILNACNKGLDIESSAIFAALPQEATAPTGNAQTKEKAALGRLLFFDPILSGTREVACATCHNPTLGFTDGLDLPIGVNGTGQGATRHFLLPNNVPFTRRNTPTLLNVAFNGMDAAGNYDAVNAPMFYDIRARSLEAQALQPISAFEEMRGNNIAATVVLDTVVNRLQQIPQYQLLFQQVFGNNAITAGNLARALASFERTLLAYNTAFDRYSRGDLQAMTQQQKRGMVLFIQNGCNTCHSGPMFSDYKTHVLGIPDNNKLTASDQGAGNVYAFRTPTLRNLQYTAPYMHNGAHKTLDEVLAYYDVVTRGGGINPHITATQLDTALRARVTLSNDLIAFLNALNDDGFDRSMPATVPSGLPVGGNIH